ncbi:MAG TPA: helix-turn-helix transcriptional regulator [Candidatus Tyrphobacter sp.]
MPAKRARRVDTFPTELGANIRRCREERHLTQRELSRAAHYDLAQLSAIENGLAVPRADALNRIAEVLDVSLDRLCGRRAFTAGDKERGSPSGRSSDQLLSAGTMAVVDELRDLRRRVERLETWRESRETRPRSKT